MDLIYLLLIGILATSYPEIYEKQGQSMVRFFEKRLSFPQWKEYSDLLSEVGFEINA